MEAGAALSFLKGSMGFIRCAPFEPAHNCTMAAWWHDGARPHVRLVREPIPCPAGCSDRAGLFVLACSANRRTIILPAWLFPWPAL